MICVRCNRDMDSLTRGLCKRCYRIVSRAGERENYPRSTVRYDYAKLDPHLNFVFKEAAIQNITLQKLADKSGYSYSAITMIPKRQTIKFSFFKTLIEALGYEIMIVAKEPADAPGS